MPLKAKLILLTLLPLVLVTASIGWISMHQAKSLGERELETLRTSLMSSREQSLRDTVDIAFDSIGHIYNDPTLSEAEAKQRVKSILNLLRYGTDGDGYFFAYDHKGTNLVHPILPDLVGQNLLHIEDRNGDRLIEELLKAAQQGGGFHQYLWQKPSTGETVPKLSYAAWLDKWQWMIGTGVYIEDISQEIAKMQAEINHNVNTTVFSIVVILGVTVSVIIVLTLAVNLHEHRVADKNLKELAHRTVMFQEDEKKHLARELHDGINQLLVSGKCHLELGMAGVEAPNQEHLAKSRHSIQTAINEVRRISHNLRPSVLDDIGLESALTILLNDFASHTQIAIETALDTQAGKLHTEVATTLYRVAQESLTNIEKHAQATKVELRLQQMGDHLQMIIRDDGQGFQLYSAKNKKGIGLRNMRERVEFIGGEFEIHSEPSIGTEIAVLLNLRGNVR
ncbi:cache domain-containing protein [Vibrio sp. SCSIO 43136]|uniref:cache domain-containing protein n=1 Tax=Vibrio sp. SCSIO 43136 TaxID=2819101 RepID=UPI002074CE37|nr:cache domain-containing protein [Vibrio sp. SCSIO 43136]USD66401.1 cache domain-containing protein [Vibrio sp. SCSIO 43136]